MYNRFSFSKLKLRYISLIISVIIVSNLVGAEPQEHDGDHFNFDLKRGERLFYGLTGITNEQNSCVSCHNTVAIDTFNWNPSALDIAQKFKTKSLSDFKTAINSPLGKTISEKHSGYNYSDEDLVLLKKFLDEFSSHAKLEQKPVFDNLIIFILLTILFLLAIVDLIFTQKIKFKVVHLVLIVFILIYNTNTVVQSAIAVDRQQNYQPDQPIKFSHQIHATENQIDCKYCHTTVEYSKTASIPSANVCLNCHTLVNEGTNSGRWEIAKIHEAVETNTPIEWVKVHNLPDHVFFSHAQHVGVAQLDCADCHGVVEEMHVIQQVEDLSMGWCLDCHKTNEVPFTSNQYYGDYEKLHEELKSGKIDKVTVQEIGGTNCMKCHY